VWTALTQAGRFLGAPLAANAQVYWVRVSDIISLLPDSLSDLGGEGQKGFLSGLK